ncbi:Tn3 family transposase [Nonomuraea thailandensis]|uniref:Tn3 family transposase n=1 Tax=Nonomuraea thailandensis TaxID=1188745 RepID=UPI003557980E
MPQFLASMTALSGGSSRMSGLKVTVAACLTSQALNIGYGPVSSLDVPALDHRRIGHVGRTYLRAARLHRRQPAPHRGASQRQELASKVYAPPCPTSGFPTQRNAALRRRDVRSSCTSARPTGRVRCRATK